MPPKSRPQRVASPEPRLESVPNEEQEETPVDDIAGQLRATTEPRHESPLQHASPLHTVSPPCPPSPFNTTTTEQLTQAILLMTNELRRRDGPSHKVKAKEPDTFDGSNPKKLNNFIMLCNLYFRNSSAYGDDINKVNFALSYLRGSALDYFEPSILDSDEYPEWIDNYSAFLRTLRSVFGPIDPTTDAEDGIDHLRMQDNQKIVKYNIEFNKLASRTGWDDGVLQHRYYSRLADRIKDIMGQQGKPPTLEDMKILAHSIDSRYWERAREKSRSGRNKSDSDKPDKPKSDDKKNKASSSGHNHNHNHNSNNNKSDKKQQGNNKGNNNKSDKPSTSSGTTNSI